MDRHRLHAGRLGEPLRRAPRRRRQPDPAVADPREMHDRLDDRRLTDAGTAGDDRDRVAQRGLDREPLLGGELHGGDRLERVDRRADVECKRPRA